MKNLYSALAKAQREVRAAHKDGRNKALAYDYASVESMISTAKRALLANDLVLFSTGTSVVVLMRDVKLERQRMDGKTGEVISRSEETPPPILASQREFLLVHSPSGESVAICYEVPIVMENGRPYDKAALAADSASLSYVLRNLLMIPRGDEEIDQDVEPAPAEREAPPPREAPKAEQKPAPKAEQKPAPKAEPAQESTAGVAEAAARWAMEGAIGAEATALIKQYGCPRLAPAEVRQLLPGDVSESDLASVEWGDDPSAAVLVKLPDSEPISETVQKALFAAATARLPKAIVGEVWKSVGPRGKDVPMTGYQARLFAYACGVRFAAVGAAQ